MNNSLEGVWKKCLQTISKHVNQQSFRTWFEPIKPVKLNGSVLTIQVPSQFFYEWLEEHYVSLLRKSIRTELGQDARLEYQIVVETSSENELNGGTGMNNTFNFNNSASKQVHQSREQNYSKKNTNAQPDTNIKNPFVIPGIKDIIIESQLIHNHTFENFVEGESNQLARSAAIAVANNPGGTAFNPLLLYGGVGLGKTHLAHAIGNFVKQNRRDKMVLYVSSEKFTNQFIDAVKGGSLPSFVNFYQLIDVLIVDDVQFFANKDRTQDIFFNTFNHLHQGGKQIVLTSDRAPKDINGIEERLLSRFKWGLSADIQVPDFETRIAILEKKLHNENIEISRKVVEYIAYHVNTNVREMEGALVSLIAHSSLNRREIDVSLAKGIVRNLVDNVSKDVSVEFIQQVVSDYFSVPVEDMKSKTRKRAVVQARQVSMYFAKKFTENSLKAIGKYFGDRDHSTVIHACQSVLNLMDTDKGFQDDVVEIQKQLDMSS